MDEIYFMFQYDKHQVEGYKDSFYHKFMYFQIHLSLIFEFE